MAKKKVARKLTGKHFAGKKLEDFVIEKDIPVPKRGVKHNPYKAKLLSTLNKMKAGDSVFISDDRLSQSTTSNICTEYNRGNKTLFAVRKNVSEPIKGSRVWIKRY